LYLVSKSFDEEVDSVWNTQKKFYCRLLANPNLYCTKEILETLVRPSLPKALKTKHQLGRVH
jgi:hypothetical protein